MTALVVHIIRRIRCSPAYRFSGQWGPISRHITRSQSQTAIYCVTDDLIWRSDDNHYITRFSKLVPKCVESDLDAFFLQFEDLAAGMKWEKYDWAILIHTAVFGKAATVIAAMSQENKFDYDEVKSVILKAYELRPEAYRQKFRNNRKNEKQTFVEFVVLDVRRVGNRQCCQKIVYVFSRVVALRTAVRNNESARWNFFLPGPFFLVFMNFW